MREDKGSRFAINAPVSIISIIGGGIGYCITFLFFMISFCYCLFCCVFLSLFIVGLVYVSMDDDEDLNKTRIKDIEQFNTFVEAWNNGHKSNIENADETAIGNITINSLTDIMDVSTEMSIVLSNIRDNNDEVEISSWNPYHYESKYSFGSQIMNSSLEDDTLKFKYSLSSHSMTVNRFMEVSVRSGDVHCDAEIERKTLYIHTAECGSTAQNSCEGIGGKYIETDDGDEDNCFLKYYLDTVCLSVDPINQVFAPIYPGQATGCYTKYLFGINENINYDKVLEYTPFHYTQLPPNVDTVTENIVRYEFRSIHDPFIKLNEITDGKYDFGELYDENDDLAMSDNRETGILLSSIPSFFLFVLLLVLPVSIVLLFAAFIISTMICGIGVYFLVSIIQDIRKMENKKQFFEELNWKSFGFLSTSLEKITRIGSKNMEISSSDEEEEEGEGEELKELEEDDSNNNEEEEEKQSSSEEKEEVEEEEEEKDEDEDEVKEEKEKEESVTPKKIKKKNSKKMKKKKKKSSKRLIDEAFDVDFGDEDDKHFDSPYCPIPQKGHFDKNLIVVKSQQKVSSGTYGEVILALLNLGDEVLVPCAIKKIFIRKAGYELEVRKEVEIMKRLKHKNLLNCFGCYKEGNYIFIVTQFCKQGDLYRRKTSFSIDEKIRLLFEIVEGMVYLHKEKIVHLDLKTQNVLICNNTAKICDFGTSKYVSENVGFVGTAEYLAPEVISPKIASDEFRKKNKEISMLVDIYAFGIIIWEVLAGETPFRDIRKEVGKDHTAMLRKIHTEKIRPDVEKLPKDEKLKIVKSVMKKCWRMNPERRIQSFEEIREKLLKIEGIHEILKQKIDDDKKKMVRSLQEAASSDSSSEED